MIIECTSMGINGEGIGHAGKIPVFCTGVLPGEKAEVRVIEQTKTYMKAECVRLIERSPYRIPADSGEYRTKSAPLACLAYEQQLYWKTQILEETLWKYARVNRNLIRKIHPSPSVDGYRSECKLPVGLKDGKLVTGLYQSGTNHFVPIDHFESHTADLEELRRSVLDVLNTSALKPYDRKSGHGLRFLVLRAIQHSASVTLVTGKDQLSPALVQQLTAVKDVRTVAQSINTEKRPASVFGKTNILAGDEHIHINIRGFDLQLSPESFFQLNVPQAEKLYEAAVNKVDPCDHLLEAYCGVGAMSLMARDKARKITGVENVPKAIENANANAASSRTPNVTFLCLDAAEGLKAADQNRPPDALLADPPRAGMDDAMLEAVLDSDIRRIVYVSCSPSSLAKNLKVLKQAYHVVTVIPFDMFPNTAHIESITVLTRQ